MPSAHRGRSSSSNSTASFRCRRGFNYDASDRGATSSDAASKALKERGYRICSRKVQIGSGWRAYRDAKAKLRRWRQFQLGWASVDPATPVRRAQKVCVRAGFPGLWLLNPLKTVYVRESMRLPLPIGRSRCFSFANGTLAGHVLSGEERFAVSIDRADRSVHYSVSSFSKPAHIAARVGYPFVCLLQSAFLCHSARRFKSECAANDA